MVGSQAVGPWRLRGTQISLPSPRPRIEVCKYQHKRVRSIPRTILSKPGKTSLNTRLGAGARATVLANTYTHNTHSTAPEPPNTPKNTHSQKHTFGLGGWGWGWGLGHELRNRAPCNNGSRQANGLSSNNSLDHWVRSGRQKEKK